MKNLYLDDIRPIPEGFDGVRSFEEFVSYITENGLPDYISFDHDLGEGKSGYDCAKWLVEYCLDHELDMPEFNVHSQNPVGRENIEGLLGGFEKSIKKMQT